MIALLRSLGIVEIGGKTYSFEGEDTAVSKEARWGCGAVLLDCNSFRYRAIIQREFVSYGNFFINPKTLQNLGKTCKN